MRVLWFGVRSKVEADRYSMLVDGSPNLGEMISVFGHRSL